MSTNLRLAILCLCLVIPTIQTSLCKDFVLRQERRKFAKAYSNLNPEEKAFNDYSGSNNGGSDFGNRDLCLATPNMYYFVTVKRFQVDVGLLASGFDEHALCLPKDCSRLLHTTNDPLLIRIYWAKGYNAWVVPPLVNVHHELYDPAENIKSKSTMFYVTCVFMLAFVLMSIVSMIVLLCRNKKVVLGDLERPHKEKQKRCDWFLKSFDLKGNVISLYQTAAEQKQNQHIAIFQFLRVMTTYWVIFFHLFGLLFPHNVVKPKTQSELDYYESPKYELQKAGDLTVEYFFMMTGFLGAYTLVPKLSKQGSKILALLSIIRHRILRVRPLYIVALLVMWQVTPFLMTGPRWHIAEFNSMACDNTWWRNILMIDNIMNLQDLPNTGGYCFLYGWYLSAEFQIYIVAIIVFAIYAKYRKMGYLLVIVLILQSFILALVTHLNLKIDYFKYTHETFLWSLSKHKYLPYARWYTLFIGAFWGLLYYEYNKLKKKNLFWIYETKPLISYLTMICGAVLNLYTVFAQFHRNPETMSENARYAWDPLRMLLITVSITMIFMPLLSNRHFYLKSFFNLRVFQILGKTSYAVYLFQIDFIELVQWTTVETFPFSYERILLETVKVIATTQAFGLFAHIFLEKPMLNLETHLFPPIQEEKSTSVSKNIDSDARLKIQSNRKKSEEEQEEEEGQTLIPEHVRPVGSEASSSLKMEQKGRE